MPTNDLTKTLALAAALTLAVSGAALAQSSTGKGGTGGTTDSASPVRNNTGNSMRPTNDNPGATTGSTGTMAPGATTGGTMGTSGAGGASGGTGAR
ncbi:MULTISPECIES: hypothetical protein [unclassified Methylobacterium]|uniref:hypothetical protein n=1 Tax=unclassified Methylobacterium TaxID=2615210 RepID=UPI003702DFA6